MITRTFKGLNVTFEVYSKVNGKVTNEEKTEYVNTSDAKKAEIILSKKYKDCMINILHCEDVEEKYGMSVDVFIANAQKL